VETIVVGFTQTNSAQLPDSSPWDASSLAFEKTRGSCGIFRHPSTTAAGGKLCHIVLTWSPRVLWEISAHWNRGFVIGVRLGSSASSLFVGGRRNLKQKIAQTHDTVDWLRVPCKRRVLIPVPSLRSLRPPAISLVHICHTNVPPRPVSRLPSGPHSFSNLFPSSCYDMQSPL
jgi:hypothetical protein